MMPVSVAAPRALGIAAALLLAACNAPADPPAAAAPGDTATASAPPRDDSGEGASPSTATDAVGLPGGAVRELLVARYGELAQLQGDWPGMPVAGSGLGDAAASRSVCAREAIGSVAAPAELLAVCGVPDDAGHATPSITDFFLLRQRGDAVEVAAFAHRQDFGSLGDITDIAVRRLGAARHGFVIDSGFTGQGITVGTRDIVLADGHGFHDAASLRSAIDNAVATGDCAAGGDCDQAVFDVSYALAVDDSQPDADAYPLLVHAQGRLCGRPIDERHRLPFNAASGRWQVPAALLREGCD